MPGETPHLPEEKEPAPGGAIGGSEAGPVETQQDRTMVASLLSTFVRLPAETDEQMHERFIDQMLIPSLERGPLPEARDFIAGLTGVLERGLPTAAQAREWTSHAEAIVVRTTLLLTHIQRIAGEVLGPVAAFAMGEVAHRCPKYLQWVIKMRCVLLADALEAGHTDRAQEHRIEILRHIGGEAVMPADQRFAILLKEYSIAREDFQEEFRKAGRGIQIPGNYGEIMSQVNVRFADTIRDVLRIQRHEYEVKCATNLPGDRLQENVIPRAGLALEVIMELIMNALKVMEGAGTGRTIMVSVVLRQNGSLVLKVRDDGPGIGNRDPEELFAAGETTTQRFGGTGMGLTFLRQNIERHFQGFLDGQKNSDIDGGPGMTFVCILPPAGGWPKTAEDE